MTIVYSEESGLVLFMTTAFVGSLSTIECEIPDGYILTSVDPTTKEPVFEPIYKTEKEKELEDVKSVAMILASTATTLTDDQALSMPEYFPTWPSGVNAEGVFVQGQIVSYKGVLYRIKQPTVAPVETQTPEDEGMLSVYQPIVPSHDGSIDDPIPWINGMKCEENKYYLYEGHVYKAKKLMDPCVWAPSASLVNEWEMIS